MSIRDGISSVVEAIVEEVYCAIKGYSLQVRRDGDDANMIS
jgi:putative hemolysin